MKFRASAITAVLVFSACATPRLKLGQTPEGEVIDVVGETPLDKGDFDGSKRRALLDAKKNAVEMVVGVQISAKTKVEKATLIDSKILAQSDGYIIKYDILREWEKAPQFKTKIRALVAYQQIANDLRTAGILREPQVGNPRAAVLLTETVKGGGEAPTFAGDALSKALIAKGFRVVDRADLMAAKATEIEQEVNKGDTSRVASLGRQLDAEILIFGSVEGEKMENTGMGDLVSIRATLSARAHKAQSDEILASASTAASGIDSARGPAVMKAFSKVGEMAGEELGPALLEALKRRAFVAVTVKGLHGLEHLKQVENILASAAGVQDTYLRSFDNGEARMEVAIKGISSQDLAYALDHAQGLKAKIESVTNETVALTVQ